MPALLTDDFYQYPCATVAVELTIKNLFPRSKIELASRDRDDHFPAHEGAFKEGVEVRRLNKIDGVGQTRIRFGHEKLSQGIVVRHSHPTRFC